MVWGCLVARRRRCLACGKLFVPCPQVKEQQYCSKPECQKERKRRWHRKKLLDDPAYVHNRRDAQRRWREAHPDYWRKYRNTNPASVEKNRQRQRERNRLRTGRLRGIAKTDASWGESDIIPGRYLLVPVGPGTIAKTDAINVELRVVSRC
jgi:hypothetical protein